MKIEMTISDTLVDEIDRLAVKFKRSRLGVLSAGITVLRMMAKEESAGRRLAFVTEDDVVWSIVKIPPLGMED